MAAKKEHRVEIRNKKASFDYEFLETFEAGIVLVGTEIKSIRMGKVSLVDSFCYFVGASSASGGKREGSHDCRRQVIHQ